MSATTRDVMGSALWLDSRDENGAHRRNGPPNGVLELMAAIGTVDPVFYRRWILANGWAEAAGLGTTFVLGREAAPWLERATGAATVILGALAAVFLGLILEVLSWAWRKRPSFA